MKDSQQHQTTKSSRKLAPSERLGKLHPRWIGSIQPGMKGRRFGLAIVVSSKVRRRNGYIELKVKCTKCGRIWWIIKSNLVKPEFHGCKKSSMTKSKHQWVLGRRYDAIFKSRAEFVKWVEKNLPHPDYKGTTIGRINNDGHYKPGNLRLETTAEQNLNKRTTLWMTSHGERILFHDFDSPYDAPCTSRLVHRGMTGEQIITDAIAHTKKGHRSKTWRKLAVWLNSHGYTT